MKLNMQFLMHSRLLSNRVPLPVPLLILFVILLGCGPERSGFSSEIRPVDLDTHIQWLANPSLEGRLAGSPFEARAANYVSDYFRESGLEPGGSENTYLQLFRLEGPVADAMGVEGHLSRNVIGLVPGTRYPEEAIVVGAHYDGQGKGGVISLLRDVEEIVHPGADDNASGTAGLLELAHFFSENPLERTVLFVAFSGEELGLIGSRYFVDNPVNPEMVILALINLDMIGRMEGERLTVTGTGTMERWEQLLLESNEESLDLEFVEYGAASSDHTSFHEKGIPAVHLFTGTHVDYHRPGDTADKINIEGAVKTTRLAGRLISALDTLHRDDFRFHTTADELE